MLKKLEGIFCFHGIGQGLFYSGQIKINGETIYNTQINFIYDCGTAGKIKDSQQKKLIKQVQDQYTEKDIDLLFISHWISCWIRKDWRKSFRFRIMVPNITVLRICYT